MSDTLKRKLKGIQDDVSQLRTERASKLKARDDAREAFAQSEATSIDSPEGKAAIKALEELGSVDDKINELTGAEVGILKMLGETEGTSDQRELFKDAAEAAFIDAETETRLKSLAGSRGRFGQLDLGEAVSKADLVGTANSRRAPFSGFQLLARRQLSLLDLIPTGAMTGNSLPYVQEGGTYAAAETTEVTAKPEAGITLTDAQADAATIAHWKKLAKQALEDVPALRTVVSSHLVYGVQRRLEGQILVGNGTTPNLRGIRNTSGIQTQGFTANPIATLLLQAIAKVFIAEGEANAIVVNPTDWATILTERDGSGGAGTGGYLVGGNAAASGQMTQTLWGVPLIPNANQPAGFATVGDFAQGATLFVRSGVSVYVSDSDQDDFIKNRVTLLGEMRAALAVWRPALFVDTDIITP